MLRARVLGTNDHRVTYSIVARDAETGCLGAAVQSGVLAIGTQVPAARSGVGAVVVQAGSELTWRSMLLDLLANGMRAEQAVRALSTLPGSAEAQFAAVGARGPAAAFTGPDCIAEAGHVQRDAVSVQANMMAAPRCGQPCWRPTRRRRASWPKAKSQPGRFRPQRPLATRGHRGWAPEPRASDQQRHR